MYKFITNGKTYASVKEAFDASNGAPVFVECGKVRATVLKS